MRCVEAWSMVIPWIGFPLSRLLEDVQPKPEAKFVRFLSFYDRKQMPGDASLPFPYFEGLRMDEAMHDLTILATGLYGKALPPQDGAPIRLVVPWKYGFKSAKSILKIELVAICHQRSGRRFLHGIRVLRNVNPNVPHPRWSQASERRIGELARRPTLLFNGYNQVAPLYKGMDLANTFNAQSFADRVASGRARRGMGSAAVMVWEFFPGNLTANPMKLSNSAPV